MEVILILLFGSCKVIFYNVPNVTDYKIFPYRTIHNSPDDAFRFPRTNNQDNLGATLFANDNFLLPNVVTLDEYIGNSNTAAFMIIRNDTIIYEKYNGDYSRSSIFNTFSVTKAFVTTLVGIAIDEGHIKSVDQSITEYIPELSDKDGFSEIKIRHLLLHTSGIKFSNSKFNPFSDNARYYYGRNLRDLVLKAKLYTKPGLETNYSSTNLQLLGIILERATNTTLSYYLEDKIWRKIGMEYNATWSVDNRGDNQVEKSFACLNCTAVDLAKLGRLYLNDGLWDDQRILSNGFISEATRRDTIGGSCWNFQYNFRPGPAGSESYFARGLYGQLLYICPNENIIIVRMGESDLKYNPHLMTYNIEQIIFQLKQKKHTTHNSYLSHEEYW